jgi:hypothetical protein
MQKEKASDTDRTIGIAESLRKMGTAGSCEGHTRASAACTGITLSIYTANESTMGTKGTTKLQGSRTGNAHGKADHASGHGRRRCRH